MPETSRSSSIDSVPSTRDSKKAARGLIRPCIETLRGLTAERLVLSFPFLADSYSWIFPRPGGASVGIAYSPRELNDSAARRSLEQMLDRYLPAAWRELPGPRRATQLADAASALAECAAIAREVELTVLVEPINELGRRG